MTYIFDCEVFAYDWLFVFKEIKSGEYTIIHNDNEAIKEFMSHDPLLAGFNNKHYDQFILKAILADATPEQVKEVNDFIIAQGGIGWQHPIIQENKSFFDQFDLFDDCQVGLSLKAIEAHLGMDIRESEVDFNIDRPLTAEELEETIFYCKHDVDATEKLYNLRKNYLQTKIDIGNMCGIPNTKALYMTNAKLTAAFLGAVKQEHDDEREYKIPSNLDLRYVPKEVLEFYGRIHDPSIPREELFQSKLNIKMGDCDVVVSYGGIHGCIPNYNWEENRDVETT